MAFLFAITPEPVPAHRGLDRALAWIRMLASEIGPRRPTGPSERIAAERMRDELSRAGVRAELLIGRALEVGRGMIATIDRGEAD